jgi:LysR family transcriptional regulator, transcriptional activator of the cysJI operon
MTLSSDNLKLFKDIALSRSISKGAAQNQVSQSAASQHIQELERHLGVVLLDRSTRPLSVTEPGRMYLDFCRDVLRRQEDFDAALDGFRRGTEGRVRVAAIYSVQLSEMAELESAFSTLYPDGELRVEYLRPEKVYEAVLADAADIGLVSYPEATREITVIPWRQEEMVVAASPNHPLASRGAIRPEDLAGADFISFDEDLPIRREIDRFLAEHGVEVRRAFHFDNLQMIKEAVEQRAGLAILPARVMQAELAQGRLAGMPFANAALYRPLGIIHRRRKRFNRVAQAFLELLQEAPSGVAAGI